MFKMYSFFFLCRRIEEIVTNFGTSLHVELQQRGIEYAQLFTKHVALRPAIMERIPPLENRPQHHDGSGLLTNGGEGGNGFSNGDGDDGEMLMDDLNLYSSGSNGGRPVPPAQKDSVFINSS